MARFMFRGCRHCGGDLFLNQGDWQCLQCGRYRWSAAARPVSDGEFWAFWRGGEGGPADRLPVHGVLLPPEFAGEESA